MSNRRTCQDYTHIAQRLEDKAHANKRILETEVEKAAGCHAAMLTALIMLCVLGYAWGALP